MKNKHYVWDNLFEKLASPDLPLVRLLYVWKVQKICLEIRRDVCVRDDYRFATIHSAYYRVLYEEL
jgi:hypothetical protein